MACLPPEGLPWPVRPNQPKTMLLLVVGSVRVGPSPWINSVDLAWCVPGEFVASLPVVAAAAAEVSASYHEPVNDDGGLPKTNAAEAALGAAAEVAAGDDGCDEGGGGDHC